MAEDVLLVVEIVVVREVVLVRLDIEVLRVAAISNFVAKGSAAPRPEISSGSTSAGWRGEGIGFSAGAGRLLVGRGGAVPMTGPPLGILTRSPGQCSVFRSSG